MKRCRMMIIKYAKVVNSLLCIGIVILMGSCVFQTTEQHKQHVTTKRIVRRDCVARGERMEIWRVSTYQLISVDYDTVIKAGIDTAHELPRSN